ncbi:hypothetical protein [Pseudaestuariivita atlantica]|uniref:Uncharacterized protein n=1 Tax=Pseudaestuariivita atlantica TaxID=1317121 RepID=A0A0L1JTW2_9RHOB|nr:hypothetical protein [Pseudaestuariivita atlantica]KNG94848.1 hypothetical protein ATO11_05555 [Pseudaestuariivita atlantica]
MTAIAVAAATPVFADSRTDTLCGDGHVTEAVGADDVVANPDGYYIRSLKTQISHGDPRIILSNDPGFHLCTTSAATPDMDASRVHALTNTLRVRFLFVPIECPKRRPVS